MGFITFPEGGTESRVVGFRRHSLLPGPTTTPKEQALGALDDGFVPNFLAAKVLLPSLKDRASSFTLLSGAYAYQTPAPNIWLATLKNAALNALGNGLFAEFKDNAVRINVFCLGFAVATLGQTVTALGYPGTDSEKLGPFFTTLALSQQKSKIIDAYSLEEALQKAK